MSSLPLDFNDLIHELRGREIERLPAGARNVLSGGCPNRHYFDWFAQRYPSTIDSHLGIELFRDPPPDLPPGAQYVRGNLGDLAPVADASIDLVFAGQVIEHLWADDLAGFLIHAHRVLRPGGHVVIDSPNRLVALDTGWHMPEHTLELAPAEARELLGLAGFDVTTMRGLWLCADPATGQSLGLHPDATSRAWSVDRRALEAADAPDEAFVWWVIATRADRLPRDDALRARVRELFATKRPEYFGRLMHTIVGIGVVDDGRRLFLSDAGSAGPVLIGPYVALEPGRWSAQFSFEGYGAEHLAKLAPDTVVAILDVVVGEAQVEIARREVRAAELPHGGQQTRLTLDFTLAETQFAGQTRVHSTGEAPLAVAHAVAVIPAGTVQDRVTDASPPLRTKNTRFIRAEQKARNVASRLVRRVRPGA